MAIIAGFDPSITHLGWVLCDTCKSGEESLVNTGTFKTDPKDGLITERLIMQRERVYNFLIENKITFVSMEAPYWGDASTELLFALNQFLHEVFLNLKIYVVYFQPITIKKFAVPHMNPREIHKPHMVHQAKTELNKMGKRFSEHIADAYFAAKIGARFYRWAVEKELKDTDLTEFEQHSFCGKHTFIRGEKKGFTEYTGIIYKEYDQFFDYEKRGKNTETIKAEVRDEREERKSNDSPRVLQSPGETRPARI